MVCRGLQRGLRWRHNWGCAQHIIYIKPRDRMKLPKERVEMRQRREEDQGLGPQAINIKKLGGIRQQAII